VKKIAVIPTLLTLGNGVCGFAAIAWASKLDGTDETRKYFVVSGWLIVAAMLFDALDGYIARISRTVSRFGAELDSLCDVISFGVAPAFLLLRLGPGWEPRPLLHQLLASIAALYVVCAILRLARFNVEQTVDPAAGKRFRGLPSPGAAGCIASLAILWGDPDSLQRWPGLEPRVVRAAVETCATFGALAVALLMVSRVPFPHVTKQMLRGRRPFSHLVQVILLGFVVFVAQEFALLLAFWIYALGIPLRYQFIRSRRREEGPGPAGTVNQLPR
jgi:CDP-diacylglycerol--serine O-phosphatidyltransferase